MATHSSILPGEFKGQRSLEAGPATVHGVTKESDMTEHACTPPPPPTSAPQSPEAQTPVEGRVDPYVNKN